jgi:hypothetical protein
LHIFATRKRHNRYLFEGAPNGVWLRILHPDYVYLIEKVEANLIIPPSKGEIFLPDFKYPFDIVTPKNYYLGRTYPILGLCVTFDFVFREQKTHNKK